MPRKVVAPQRREQIVKALFQCLADKGHETVTVKDIAEQASLHYGVIHYYFKSKDDIVAEMADTVMARYDKLLLDRVRPFETATDKMRMALDFLVDEFIFNRRLNRVFYNLVQMAFENGTVRKALRKQLRTYRDRIAEVVEEGVRNGEFASQEPADTAALMVALIEGMALQWVVEPKALNRDAVRETIERTVERHLREA